MRETSETSADARTKRKGNRQCTPAWFRCDFMSSISSRKRRLNSDHQPIHYEFRRRKKRLLYLIKFHIYCIFIVYLCWDAFLNETTDFKMNNSIQLVPGIRPCLARSTRSNHIRTSYFSLEKSNYKKSFKAFSASRILRRMLMKNERENGNRRRRKRFQRVDQMEWREVTRIPVVIMSGHRRVSRVLYAMKHNVIAGKRYGAVIRERYNASVFFDLIGWADKQYSLQLRDRASDVNLYVIADILHGGLRVCAAASANTCVRRNLETNATTATPLFRLKRFKPSRGSPVFANHLGMSFEFGDKEKYIHITDDTGEAELTESPINATKFTIILSILV